MGFSLVGNSGSSSSNVYETSYSASLNPQLSGGNAPGQSLQDLSPLLQASSIANYAPSVSSFYAPLNIVSTGANYGDSALNALGALQGTQTSATDTTAASGDTSTLSSLLSGNSLYWIIGAIVLLFFAGGKN